MEKKILDSKVLYAVLSVIIAVALWFYVVSLEDNTVTRQVTNIPVQFVGTDVLESRGLMIVGETPTVSLTVTTAYSTFPKLKDSVSVTVDVSSIAAPQEYSMGYNVTWPSNLANSIQEDSRTPTNVTFTVARYAEQEKEVRGVFNGTVAEGYLQGDADDFLFSPATIVVSGAEDLVNQVAYAQVVIDGDDLTESVSGEYSYTLMSNSGEVLEGLDVECSVDTIYATFPIWATAEVPLSVNFIYGGGATEDNVTYEISESTIMISGNRDDMAGIEEIELEPIDLTEVQSGDEITRKIPLANELNNLSGYTEVTITVYIKNVDTINVETSNITCDHVPDGWTAELITKAITVTIRGPKEELDAISGDSIRVVADLTDINQAAGQYTITARVYLDSVGSEAGVLGSDYRVVVTLSQ
jgi:YbbR domain-containing protein